jgi:hypothetical protein
MYRVTLMVAAVALLAISAPVHASKTDDCGCLGLVTSYTMGGFIHIVLVIAVIVVIVGFI